MSRRRNLPLFRRRSPYDSHRREQIHHPREQQEFHDREAFMWHEDPDQLYEHVEASRFYDDHNNVRHPHDFYGDPSSQLYDRGPDPRDHFGQPNDGFHHHINVRRPPPHDFHGDPNRGPPDPHEFYGDPNRGPPDPHEFYGDPNDHFYDNMDDSGPDPRHHFGDPNDGFHHFDVIDPRAHDIHGHGRHAHPDRRHLPDQHDDHRQQQHHFQPRPPPQPSLHLPQTPRSHRGRPGSSRIVQWSSGTHRPQPRHSNNQKPNLKPKRSLPQHGKKVAATDKGDWVTIDEVRAKDNKWVTIDNWESRQEGRRPKKTDRPGKDDTSKAKEDALKAEEEAAPEEFFREEVQDYISEEVDGNGWMGTVESQLVEPMEELNQFETWLQSNGEGVTTGNYDDPDTLAEPVNEDEEVAEIQPGGEEARSVSIAIGQEKPQPVTTTQDEQVTSAYPMTFVTSQQEEDQSVVTSSERVVTLVEKAAAEQGEDESTTNQLIVSNDPGAAGVYLPVAEFITSLGNTATVDKGLWQCNVCQIFLNSENQARGHFDGSKHKKRLKHHQLLYGLVGDSSDPSGKTSNTIEPSGKPFDTIEGYECTQTHCSLCSALFPSALQAIDHYVGKKHTSKKAALLKPKMPEEVAKAVVPNEILPDHFTCFECNIVCNSLSQYNQHMKSARHVSTGQPNRKRGKRNHTPGATSPDKQQFSAGYYTANFIKAQDLESFATDSWNPASFF